MGFLRFFLACAIVLGHARSGFLFPGVLPSGDVAVELFYVISGFYMSLILTVRYADHPVWLFYSNRFLRLFPVYWVVLLLSVLFFAGAGWFFGQWGLLKIYRTWQGSLPDGSLLALGLWNLPLFSMDWIHFLEIDAWTGELSFTSDFRTGDPALWRFMLIPQGWSLGIELLFYLMAPFLAKRNSRFLLGLILLSWLTRLLTYHAFGWYRDPWNYRFFPSELAFFLGGMLACRLYLALERRQLPRASVALAALLFFAVLASRKAGASWWFLLEPYGLRDAPFFLCLTLGLPFVFRLTRESRLDRWIGELSYPIYVSHWLVIHVGDCVAGRISRNFALFATILVAILLWVWVVEPVDKLRGRRVAAGMKPLTACRG